MSYLDRPLREHLSVFDELRAAQIDAWNHATYDDDRPTRADVEEGPVPLERCICGECFHCPDGWHHGDDLPCGCTPDCVLDEDDDDD